LVIHIESDFFSVSMKDNDTVQMLKDYLWGNFNLTPQPKIVYRGKYLEDNDTLKKSKVKKRDNNMSKIDSKKEKI